MAANGITPGIGRRASIAAVAIAGWVAITVVAAGPRPSSRTWIGLPALDDLMAVAFLALVVWAIVWTARVLRVRPGAKQARPANLITLWLGLAVALAVLMVNPSIVERLLEFGPAEVAEADSAVPIEDDEQAPVDFAITANQVYVALAAIGGWMTVTAVLRRRQAGEPDITDITEEGVEGDDLSVVIQAMVDDLGVGSDPRSAVLSAYHRLEQALADQDHPRRATETPTEHLDRVFKRLPIDRTPFLRLARRYEVARFSTEPITEADRDAAAADLARARADLAGRAAR